MVIKGLKEIQEKSEEIEMMANQSRMQYVYLGDGDTAIIRFIDDNEMIQTKMHEYEEMSPQGKKYRKTYCSDNLTGSPCKWCAVGNIPKNVYVFLTYVYHIIRKNQNPALNSNPEAAKWEVVKSGGKVLYKEEVNGIRILRTKWGRDGYIKTTILGFVEEHGTLCDRDYKFSRAGLSLKTTYNFVPKDSSPESAEVTQAKVDAPSIEEVVIGNKDKNTQKISEDNSNKEVEDIFGNSEDTDTDKESEDLF